MRVSVFADDHLQSQRSGVNLFANAQNPVINDSKFVSLSHLACGYNLAIIVHRLSARPIMSISLQILAKCRRSLYAKNPIPVPSLPDGKMYSTNSGKFLLIVLHRLHDDALVSSGDWEGSERPRSVSSS